MTTPCNGDCDCPRPCPDCRSRLVPWLGLAVPQYAISQLGEDWLRARVEQRPRRVRFPGALPFAAPVHEGTVSPHPAHGGAGAPHPQAPEVVPSPDSTQASERNGGER